MGVVLKGRDVDLGRDVAVKVLLEKHRDSPEMVRRFAEEAQIAGQLQHPGLVPVYEPDGHHHAASAALEYAVLALGVWHVVVLGHGRCGGIAAALDQFGPLSATDFVGTWVRALRDLAAGLDPAAWPDTDARQRELERRSVEQSIANLRTFPWIREREQQGTLDLHGAWFDIALGELDALSLDGWATVR